MLLAAIISSTISTALPLFAHPLLSTTAAAATELLRCRRRRQFLLSSSLFFSFFFILHGLVVEHRCGFIKPIKGMSSCFYRVRLCCVVL